MTFYNARNLSYLLDQDCSVVITGDSLAYNRYDFVDEPMTDAWDCPFSMKSWSFLLRDYLVTHSRGWTPACDLEFTISHIKTSLFKKNNQRVPYLYQLPLENQGLTIQATRDTCIKFKGCPQNFCFCTNFSKGSLFDIDDLSIDLTGDPKLFNGVYYKWVKSQSGILKNVNEGAFITLAGVSEAKTEVFLTGSGSKTGEWMLENADERILRHSPDLCILLIGANNRRMNDPESFKAALYKLIDLLKARDCEILLISPPHSTTTDPDWNDDNIYLCDKERTQPIMDILYRAASYYNLPYMNLFEFFSGTPNEVWRFDNTHLTKQGNLMLYEAVVDSFFKE